MLNETASIHVLEETGSTQDAAFTLLEKNELPVWGSVLAKKQTAGRGQMRRPWVGIAGNLMVSLRLPETQPFLAQEGAIALGVLFAISLRHLGFAIALKWPNDLVLEENGEFCKTGGILLEERNGRLIAGIGINLASAPPVKELNYKPKLLPGFLFSGKKNIETPESFWRRLLPMLISASGKNPDFAHTWRNAANELLIWKDQGVICADGDVAISGILRGLGPDGAALLETESGIKNVIGGSLYKNHVSFG